jgi:signal transduction histidine kinase
MPVRDVVDAAVAVARKTALDKNVAFDVRYVFDERVRVDPDLTRSAIQNIVDNAAKYTDFGSVDVVVEGTTSEWSVHVRDTGPGLSPQELRTIFEPFRRGSTSKKGTGLGLAIARRAVETQGGSIHAESTGPGGCHFWIQLPIR